MNTIGQGYIHSTHYANGRHSNSNNPTTTTTANTNTNTNTNATTNTYYNFNNILKNNHNSNRKLNRNA